MALGGGSYVSMNKVLPGTYVNFVSASRAFATLSDRGVAALPLPLSWGETGKVMALTTGDLLTNSRKLLGFDYDHEQLTLLREVFKHATKVLVCRLNTTATVAATTYCTAKFAGSRGNDLSVVIAENVDDPSTFDVRVLLGMVEIDVQRGVTNTNQLKDNDFVVWIKDIELMATAKTPLTGGEDGTVTSADWQKALGMLESESFNTLGVVSSDQSIASLAVAFTKRMRYEVGAKFQTVVYSNAADEKGIINVTSKPTSGDSAQLVAWVTGAEAGCKVNASCTNMIYDGELEIDAYLTQAQLESAIGNGEFVFHRVGEDVRVLTDINSKVVVTAEEGEDFKSNQTVRVVDQIANDVARLFNTRYLGIIPNDKAGRVSLWNDICKIYQDLERIRAIEDFAVENVTVEQGDSKKSVVCNTQGLNIINAMEKLYMRVVVN